MVFLMLSKNRSLKFYLLAAIIFAFALGVGAPAWAATDMKRCHIGMEMGGHDVIKHSGSHSAPHVIPDFKHESDSDINKILRTVTSAFSSTICPLNGKRQVACPYSGQHGHVSKGCCLKKCDKATPGQDGFIVFTNLNYLASEINVATTLMETGVVSPIILTSSTRPDNPGPRPPRS